MGFAKKDFRNNKDFYEQNQISNGQEKKLLEEMSQGLSIERLSDGNYKIDFETTLEGVFSAIMVLSLLAMIVLALSFIGTPLLGPWDENWLYYLIPVAALILGIVLRSGTDNYYLLDKMFHKIILSRKFFFLQQTKEICSFSDVALATVRGELIHTKSSKYWTFTALLITRQGQMIELSNSVREENAAALESRVKEIAEILRIHFVPIIAGQQLQKPKGPIQGPDDLVYIDAKAQSKKHVKQIILIIALIFGGGVLLALVLTFIAK